MKTAIQQEKLPTDWSTVELGELLERITNGLTCVQEKDPPGIPVTRIETISNGVVDFERVRYVRDLDEAKKARFILQRGDILFSHINSDLHLGKTAVVTTDKSLLHGMNLLLLRTKKDLLDPHYLHYLLNYYRRSGAFMAIAQHAVNQSSLNQKKINSLKVPLAPLDQQKRIVSEIEKQFSRLDEAVANLKRVKANLKRYKAAVLKAAVEGKFTGAWRQQHPDTEPASELLQRILTERRTKWEQAELAKMQAKGKTPKDDAWKKKYPEPATPVTTGQPELPRGWVWATVEQLSCQVEYGSSSKTNVDSTGVPILRMGNIFEGELIFDDLKFLPSEHEEFPKLFLEPGDILFNRTNSPELVGKTAVFDGYQKRCSFASYLIRVRLINGCEPDYLAAFINSSHGRNWVKTVVTQQVGQANVNGTKLQALNVPLPPEAEQHIIVGELKRHFSIVGEVEHQVEANLARGRGLQMATLVRHFSGSSQTCSSLVTQGHG